MSAALTIGAIGANLFSGISQGQAAKQANRLAMDSFSKNENIANQLKERQQTLVDPVVAAKIAELSSQKATPEALRAMGALSTTTAAADRGITANVGLAGAGATGARLLTDRFRKATGLADINLQDQASKNAQLGGWLDKASQLPAWAQVATGANTQMGNFQSGQASTAIGAQNSAYGAAAQGLAGLAKLYQAGQDKKQGQSVKEANPWGVGSGDISAADQEAANAGLVND